MYEKIARFTRNFSGRGESACFYGGTYGTSSFLFEFYLKIHLKFFFNFIQNFIKFQEQGM